jgi:hypothetical protein
MPDAFRALSCHGLMFSHGKWHRRRCTHRCGNGTNGPLVRIVLTSVLAAVLAVSGAAVRHLASLFE